MKKEFEGENFGTKYLVLNRTDHGDQIYGVFQKNDICMQKIEDRLAEIPNKKKKHKKLVK